MGDLSGDGWWWVMTGGERRVGMTLCSSMYSWGTKKERHENILDYG